MGETNQNWNQLVGDWEIVGSEIEGELHEKTGGGGTANAKILCTVPVPDSYPGEMYVTIKVVEYNTGDIFRLYPCCPDTDSVGTIYAEFTFLGGTLWKIEIVGAPTSCISYMNHMPDAFGEIPIWVCADHTVGMVSARIQGAVIFDDTIAWADDCDPGPGRWAAVGHNNPVNGALFDDFRMGELRKPDGTSCFECWCWCWQTPPTKHLMLTFFDTTGRAACLEGVDIPLEWDYNNGTTLWHGEDTIVNGSASQLIGFDLKCGISENDNPLWQGKNFTLEFNPSVCCNANTPPCGVYVPLEISKCDELNLVFGPFRLSWGVLSCSLCYSPTSPDCIGDPTNPLCSGEFYIAVTESV